MATSPKESARYVSTNVVYDASPLTMLKSMEDSSAGLVFHWLGVPVIGDDYVDHLSPLIEETARVLKPGACAIVFSDIPTAHSMWHSLAYWTHSLMHGGDLVILWDGDNASKRFSPIGWYVKPGLRVRGRAVPDSSILVTHFDVSKKAVGYLPVELINFLISTFCEEGGLVVDPFCRAGSVLVAAALCDRRWVGADEDPDFVAEAISRTRAVSIDDGLESLGDLFRWRDGGLQRIGGW